MVLILFWFASLFALAFTTASVLSHTLDTNSAKSGDQYVFQSQEISYLADLNHPSVLLSGYRSEATDSEKEDLFLLSVFYTDQKIVTKDVLLDLVSRYDEEDDVYSLAFLQGVYISSTSKDKLLLDRSALEFLTEYKTKYLFLDASSFLTDISGPYIINYVKPEPAVKKAVTHTHLAAEEVEQAVLLSEKPVTGLLPGPWIGRVSKSGVALSTVYRLYADKYSAFVFGAYENRDQNNSFKALNIFDPKFGKAFIPVPSRIYSWNDERLLAGQRVAIKDLFDIKGLQTAGGSHAWAAITEPANVSAPSIQRIIDLGGVIVGKFKTAQFASAPHPWEWIDEQSPFNPRGDGYFTCSGSSAGGGCAIAGYEWLDYAIGSDTGSSMRIPAAVSGTYGNRPSQGLMTLEHVLPLAVPADTAGVFSRDPLKWVKFAKAWYQPSLYQPTTVTGLSPLIVPDTTAFPKRLLYLNDYLPLANSAAETLLQQFISNISSIFDMQVSKFDLISTIESANTTKPIMDTIGFKGFNILDGEGQWDFVARPLITKWASLNDGRFPPVENSFRSSWQNYSSLNVSDETRHANYASFLTSRKIAVDWFESNILFETEDSCSESIMIYDVGFQGLPTYRQESLDNDNGTYKYYIEHVEGEERRARREDLAGTSICPSFACVDFTLPIGQVPYKSNVTYIEEMIPVTINLVAKRGCDFMLFNMVERLAKEGVLKTVRTGREAF